MMRLRVVRCDKCGGSVQLRQGTTSGECGQCGTAVTLVEALRAERERALEFPNPTPLRLGMKAMFHGREYELIGRLVLRTREEGTTYQWDEFELIAADGDVLFLEYDEGKWKLMVPFVPEQPIGPQEIAPLGKGSSVSLGGVNATIADKGRSEVCCVEGELTFAAKVGDSRHYLDASYLNQLYVVEWNEEEIEFYRGQLLSDREVFQAFGLREQLVALDAAGRRNQSRKIFATVCLLASVCAFIAWGIALASGKVVSQGSVPIASVPKDGVRFQPMTLQPQMRVHRLVIHGSMHEASAWVAGVLEAADGRELLGTQRSFWDESGYDSDGHWHESDLNAHTNFVATRPGPYRIHLYAEPDTPRGSYGEAGYRLLGGAIYPSYFLTYAIVTLIVAVIFFFMGSKETLKKMAESSDDD
jgi:hypothetical protein